MKPIGNAIGFLIFIFALTGCIIISVTPDSGQTVMIDPGATQEFTVSTMGTGSCAWTLDGNTLNGQRGNTFAYSPAMADAGVHDLNITVTASGRTESLKWTIQVTETPSPTWKHPNPGLVDIKQTPDGGYIAIEEQYDYEVYKWYYSVIRYNAAGCAVWKKPYDGKQVSIQPAVDAGYIMVGTLNTSDIPGEPDRGLVTKLNSDGSIQWQQLLGSKLHTPAEIQSTVDGGYVIIGTTYVQMTSGTGKTEGHLIKLSQGGDLEWDASLGPYPYWPHTVQQTKDNGYIIGCRQLGVIKLDAVGIVQWCKQLQSLDWSSYGSDMREMSSIRQIDDGGYIAIGTTAEYSAVMRLNQARNHVLRLSADGNVIWDKTYGQKYANVAWSLTPAREGGFVVGGWSSDIFWGIYNTGTGDIDLTYGWRYYGPTSYLLKFDLTGGVLWQKQYNAKFEPSTDWNFRVYPDTVLQVNDGGYLLLDEYITKLDANGNL